MSLLSRADWHVSVAPERVRLRRRARQRDGADGGAQQGDTEMPCGPGAISWQGAIAALKSALPAEPARGASAAVVLSNRLVRYAVVPWDEALTSAAEEAVHATHHFVQLYGQAIARWDIAIDRNPAGCPRIASAVDPALLHALREVFGAAGIRLRSVTPQLAHVCNQYRHQFGTTNGWLVTYESECLCVGLFLAGRWISVRSFRIGNEWRDSLNSILEREICVADPPEIPDTIFLWDPVAAGGGGPVAGGDCQLVRIGASARPPRGGRRPPEAVA